MFADLGHDISAYTVSEDGASFAKLVDAIYAPEAPLTTDCIDDLSGMLSGLCESIQIKDCRCKLPGYGLIPFVCDGRVAAKKLHEASARELLPLHQQHLIDSRKSPRWHSLAKTFGYTSALEHCQKFIVSHHFDAINRCNINRLVASTRIMHACCEIKVGF